jgi:hypothetical protein
VLSNGAAKAVVFDGQNDLVFPNRRVVGFAIKVDSADFADAFQELLGKPARGNWQLIVEDRGPLDGGFIDGIKVELDFDRN